MAFGDLKVQDLIYEDGSNNEITVVLANLVVKDGSGNLVQADNKKFIAGTGSDLQIYHDGSHSYITDTGTGRLHINTSQLRVNNAADNEILISATENGAVELYYDNAKKLETISSGVQVTGDLISTGNVKVPDSYSLLAGSGNDLQIYHDGSHSYINNNTGNLSVSGALVGFMNAGNSEWTVKSVSNGAVELYYDGSKRIETSAAGAIISGPTVNTLQITGTSSHELYSYSDSGGVGWCTGAGAGNYGELVYFSESAGNVHIYAEGEQCANFQGNAAVELYYDNVKKLETTSSGVDITGVLNVSSYVSLDDSVWLYCGTGDDLAIGHNGTNARIVNTAGNLRLEAKNNELGINIVPDGAVELYYDGSKKFDTNAGGAQCYGNLIFQDNYALYLGDAYDLRIYHNGTRTIFDAATGTNIDFYYNGTQQFWFGNNEFKGKDNNKIILGNSDDLSIYHNGSNNYIKPLNHDLIFDNGSSELARISQSGTVSDSKGDLRSIPVQSNSGSHTLAAASAGKVLYTNANTNVNNNVFSAGDAVTIVNNSGSAQTITQGSGLTLYNTADASSGNRTLASRGMATIWFYDASTAYISGAGLS